jgi:hypothetical protein
MMLHWLKRFRWSACWPLVPKFVGSNPAEAVGFFGRKIPQHAFLRKGSKAVRPVSQICGTKRTLLDYVEVSGQIIRTFHPRSSVLR